MNTLRLISEEVNFPEKLNTSYSSILRRIEHTIRVKFNTVEERAKLLNIMAQPDQLFPYKHVPTLKEKEQLIAENLIKKYWDKNLLEGETIHLEIVTDKDWRLKKGFKQIVSGQYYVKGIPCYISYEPSLTPGVYSLDQAETQDILFKNNEFLALSPSPLSRQTDPLKQLTALLDNQASESFITFAGVAHRVFISGTIKEWIDFLLFHHESLDSIAKEISKTLAEKYPVFFSSIVTRNRT